MDTIKNILSQNSKASTDEKELQLRTFNYLAKYFHVELEVWSTCRKRRIDIVAVHKSDPGKLYPIGIEVKVNAKKTGKDIAAWLHQANEYSRLDFVGYGRCLIITCPQISGIYMREGCIMHPHEDENGCRPDHNIATFIGQFNIGEFKKYTRNGLAYLRIVYKGQIIWDQYKDSFRPHNYTALCPK
jgi:hypothetical protein